MSTARSWRRWLIAAGTARYDHLDSEYWLPSVDEDLNQIDELFCGRFGYQRVLTEVSQDPTTEELRRQISGWLTDSARHEDDVVVIYYSGHGMTTGGRHYLLTRDSRERNLAGTALATDEIVWMLGEDSPVHQLLVITDTCYAGRGGLDMGRVAAQLAEHRRPAVDSGAGWWFLAAARPKEEATEGALAAALAEAARQPGGMGSTAHRPRGACGPGQRAAAP